MPNIKNSVDTSMANKDILIYGDLSYQENFSIIF